MSKTINESQLRQTIRKVLQEKLVKTTQTEEKPAVAEETVKEIVQEKIEEKVSNDEWYQNSLFNSLKEKWTK